MSVNSKLTDGPDGDVRSWASSDDGLLFKQIIEDHDVMILGRKTYEQVQPKARPGLLRVVVTHNPQASIDTVLNGMLEFTDAPPEVIVSQLVERGYKKVLIAGGGEVNRLFLEAGLVDELIVTIEPVLLLAGVGLVSDGPSGKIPARLIESRQLNGRGTIMLHYKLENSRPLKKGVW